MSNHTTEEFSPPPPQRVPIDLRQRGLVDLSTLFGHEEGCRILSETLARLQQDTEMRMANPWHAWRGQGYRHQLDLAVELLGDAGTPLRELGVQRLRLELLLNPGANTVHIEPHALTEVEEDRSQYARHAAAPALRLAITLGVNQLLGAGLLLAVRDGIAKLNCQIQVRQEVRARPLAEVSVQAGTANNQITLRNLRL